MCKTKGYVVGVLGSDPPDALDLGVVAGWEGGARDHPFVGIDVSPAYR